VISRIIPLGAVLLLWGAAERLEAQTPGAEDGRPSIAAERLREGERVRVDGALDEGIWMRATAITDFRQREPVEGGAPSERTEIRIAYSADALYIGALLHDSDPDRILGHQRERDASLATDDRLMWILDTFLDERSGYFFEINPAGLMGDGLIRPGATAAVNRSWDGIWEARVARGAYGWSAEIRIPFRTLNFNPDLDSWGINFQRTVRRKNEETIWSGHLRNQSLFSPIHAGRLTGLEGISQGLGLEVKPFVTSARTTDPSGTRSPSDVGFDVSYSITPSLRASVTVNTDFAEVEVDQRRVNLTRFPISYPERRDFFLEGSSVFNFSGRNTIQPFFSRRIGLIQGEPVPIRYGARVAGQAGRYDLGAYHVRTDNTRLHPGEDFFAGRVVRNVLRESSIGLLHTYRGAEGADAAGAASGEHTLGADVELATSRFRGRNLELQAFAVAHTLGPSGEGSAMQRSAQGLRIAYPNEPWRFIAGYRALGEAYDPAVGFTPRNDFRRFFQIVGFSPRLAGHPHIRQLEFAAESHYLTDMRLHPQTWTADLTLLGVRLHSGDSFALRGTRTFERLARDFAIRPRVIIPAGDYAYHSWEIDARTAGFRTLSGTLQVGGGEFWSGSRLRHGGGLTLRPLPGVSLTSEWERNDVRLPQGGFRADLVRVGGGWHLSPWVAFSGNAQFDNLSEVVGLYGRLRWIVRPGSDLYVVYLHNWLSSDAEVRTLSRSGATKLTYTHRF
jgi:hypothetical protein